MKNTKKCPKCQSGDIVQTPYDRGNNASISLPWSVVWLTLYVCGSCGFSEEWIDSADDIAKVKKRYGSPAPG
jgi:ribosomal protein S27AE